MKPGTKRTADDLQYTDTFSDYGNVLFHQEIRRHFFLVARIYVILLSNRQNSPTDKTQLKIITSFIKNLKAKRDNPLFLIASIISVISFNFNLDILNNSVLRSRLGLLPIWWAFHARPHKKKNYVSRRRNPAAVEARFTIRSNYASKFISSTDLSGIRSFTLPCSLALSFAFETREWILQQPACHVVKESSLVASINLQSNSIKFANQLYKLLKWLNNRE